MTSFRAIIEDFGTAAFAKLISVDESHVRVMKVRDSIPAEYWGLIIDQRPSLTFKDLRELRDARFSKNDRSQPEAAA